MRLILEALDILNAQIWKCWQFRTHKFGSVENLNRSKLEALKFEMLENFMRLNLEALQIWNAQI